jgi:transglutaminase-like putative cysteine protease
VRYQIAHTTTYRYDRPVTFAPHQLQLRPRNDVVQTCQQFSQTVSPMPIGQFDRLDLDANLITQVSFDDRPATELVIHTVSQVETHCENPFDYLLESWAVRLPIDYPSQLQQQLQPYLQGQWGGMIDPIARQLAEDIWQETDGNTSAFLTTLNQRIDQTCTYQIRPMGAAWPPGLTWRKQTGSCRDLTVLFIEVCRSAGLAARFVSGYEAGDPDQAQHLHAWAEVYLPGAGWRGFDPTHGLAVADRHIALVSSPVAQATLPIQGTLRSGQGAIVTMTAAVAVQSSG